MGLGGLAVIVGFRLWQRGNDTVGVFWVVGAINRPARGGSCPASASDSLYYHHVYVGLKSWTAKSELAQTQSHSGRQGIPSLTWQL